MDIIRDKTISGVNEYIHQLKKGVKGDCNFTLTLFDDISIDVPYKDVSIKQVKPLNKDTYIPTGGTPLYDAAVNALEELSKRIDEYKSKPKVIVAIMTDGEENSSKQHNEDCLKDLIRELTSEGNYTFIFLGANQDSFSNAHKWGIDRGNTVNFSQASVGNSFNLMAASSVNLANAKSLRTSNFFAGVSEVANDDVA